MSNQIKTPALQDFEGRPVGLMTSYYPPDSSRLPIALRTIQNYREAKVPVVVVDGSPESEVQAAFQELGAFVIHAPGLGLATSAKEGARFIRSSGGDRIIKHEPEKVLMPKFVDRINRALDDSVAVVVGRTPGAMRSLPTTQRETETTGGRLMTKHLGFPADALSGGRAFARGGTDELINYDHERWGDNWMHLQVPILESIRKGQPVAGVQVPLLHPPEMVREEEGNPHFDTKRATQLQLHTELIENYLRDNPDYHTPTE